MLISSTDVKRGFSVLALLLPKQRNRLKPENLDKLMRLILIGPDWFDGSTWELLIDKYDAMGEIRILLNKQLYVLNKRGPFFVCEQQNKICLLSFVTFSLFMHVYCIKNHTFFAEGHSYLNANTRFFI